jgi:hypothetical protein
MTLTVKKEVPSAQTVPFHSFFLSFFLPSAPNQILRSDNDFLD